MCGGTEMFLGEDMRRVLELEAATTSGSAALQFLTFWVWASSNG